MKNALRVFSALSDENRLRMVYALRRGELCVCQLIDLVGLSPSTVSKHLSILRDAGLLDSRKEGRWVYYRLASQTSLPMFGKGAPPIFQSLEKTSTVKSDDKYMKKICGESIESVCRRLFGKP